MDKILNPLDFAELASDPSSPASGYIRTYAKGGNIYSLLTGGQKILLSSPYFAIPFIFDEGGTVLTTGLKGGLYIPFGYTITQYTMASIDPLTTSGSIVVDIWTDTYANFPPTVADTITASAKPTISSGIKTQGTVGTWSVDQAAGRWIYFNIDSVTSFKKVCLTLTCQKT